MSFLFTLLIGIAIGVLLGRGFSSPQIKKVVAEKQNEKDVRKQSIIQYLNEHESITNNKVEELLGVGDTAAYNYLEALEREGKIEQIGKEGRSVKYHLRKDG